MTEPTTIPPIVNRSMKMILRSPMHGIVSKNILLITFTGHKSGRSYTTPVSYSQHGDWIHIFTHARWWRNLLDGAPVTVRLRGQERQALPEVTGEDKQAVAAGLAAHLRLVPTDARFYEVTLDEAGAPDLEAVARAAQTVVMIRLRLL